MFFAPQEFLPAHGAHTITAIYPPRRTQRSGDITAIIGKNEARDLRYETKKNF